jgi:hypothetical protein
VILVDAPLWVARGRRWSHLVSDESFEELHAFAAAVGLPGRAFHRDHYDVPESMVGAVVAAGAVQVPSRELVRRLRAAGLRRARPDRPAPPDRFEHPVRSVRPAEGAAEVGGTLDES